MSQGDRAADEARTGTPPTPTITVSAVTATPVRPGATTTEVLASHEDGTGLPRPPADWANFAPRPVRAPSRVGRVIGWVGHLLSREPTVLGLGALALATAVNWPALRAPARVLPGSLADSALGAYVIAWVGHALGRNPAGLWQANAFFPTRGGLALVDPLLGYAPLAFFGTGPGAATLRYNVIVILAQALAVIGPYALARQLGAARTGAAVAAVATALAPWRLGLAGHLEVLSTGGLALALALLARGHGLQLADPEPDAPPARVSPGWALVGWLVAAWQLSLGPSLGVAFGYVLAVATGFAATGWAVRRRPAGGRGWPLLLTDALGLLVTAAAAVLVGRAYAIDRYPDTAAVASTTLRGLFTAPADSLLWGDRHAGARALSGPASLALLPGFTLCALALGGLVFSVWSVWARLTMLIGVVASAELALGAHGLAHGRLGYVWLADHLPGLAASPHSGYLIAWTTLLLALLAAGGLTAIGQRGHRDAIARGELAAPGWARAALALPLVLVLLEGLGTPAYRQVPQPPAALAGVAAPYLVLPSEAGSDAVVLLWSATTFAAVGNGAGPVVPDSLARTRTATADFPSAESVEYLRRLGVRTVLARPGSPAAEAEPPPGVARDVTPDAVIFHL
ncbi:MAG: hypothetical protein ACM30G_14635 [Micromonosporaceae bacterium]